MYKTIMLSGILFFAHTLHLFAAKGPKHVSPIEGKLNMSNPVLRWESSKFPKTNYEVKISETSNFEKEKTITIEIEKNHLLLKYPFFNAGKRYYWTVRSKTQKFGNVLEITDWSHERMKDVTKYSFELVDNEEKKAFNIPEIISPQIDGTITTLQPLFKWTFEKLSNEPYKIMSAVNLFVNPSYKDLSYEYQISKTEDFSMETRTYTPIRGDSLSIDLPILRPNEKYFQRVRATYYDPVKLKQVTTDWSSHDNPTYSFLTSNEAKGHYSFSEGNPLEVFEDNSSDHSMEVLISDESNNFSPSVSMNGTMLSFISDRSEVNELYLKDLEGGAIGGIIKKTNINKNRSIHNPFWLNDDERVGFFSNLYNPSTWHIFTTNTGSGLTIMTSGMEMTEKNTDFSLSGSCSTDGRVIFAAKMYDEDPYMLYMLDLSDDSRTQLRQGVFPDIRDDDKVVFCSDETGNYEVWMVDLQGKSVFRPTLLNPHPADDFEPAFSPNGEKIAFTSNRNGNSDIWLMNADGTDLQQITTHPMVDRHPQWIDSNTIVFQSNRGKNKSEVHVYSIYLLHLN